MGLFSRPKSRGPAAADAGSTADVDATPSTRVLFLDDDPQRADVFLAATPWAVWVQTAADCIEKLAERWDEVHLDHDLGGEQFVDQSREDCGMAVVRWLCEEPRPHLRAARFQVHSHNINAALMMAMKMTAAGFHVELRPFGAPPPPPPPPEPPSLFRSPFAFLRLRVRRIFQRGAAEEFGYGYTAGRDARPDEEPLARPDFTWTRPDYVPTRPTEPLPERMDLSWARPAVPPTPPPAAEDEGGEPTPRADQDTPPA